MAQDASAERVVRGSRPYRSSRRQEQALRTRQQILTAATGQFRAVGYAGATMGGIAAAAGVSVPTVELAFGTKAALLKAAIDVAIAGDDLPVPVLERPWAAQTGKAATAAQFLAAVAGVLAETAERADALVQVAFEAARADQRLASLAEQLKAQRAVTAAWIVDRLAARAPLRPGLDRAQAIDIIWLLMDPVVFGRLTSDRGWTARQFAGWFADSALRLLTGPPRLPAEGGPEPP